MECVSMDIPWICQLLCYSWILGHEVETWSGYPWILLDSYIHIHAAAMDIEDS